MPRWIVVSEEDHHIDRDSALGVEARAPQLDEIRQFHGAMREDFRMDEWLADTVHAKAGRSKHLPVLGATVVEVDHLEDPPPGAVAYEDLDIGLIESLAAEDADGLEVQAMDSVEGVDLWHLEAARTLRQTATGAGVHVAVLDTGIGPTPELVGQVVEAVQVRSDWADGRPLPTVQAPVLAGHGTHVAGIIAGHRVGVAPGARLVDVRMLKTEKSGSLSDLLAALDWSAANENVRIVNISVGAPILQHRSWLGPIRAMNRVGVLVVAAAGNDGPGTSMAPGNFYETIAVGAMTPGREVWGRSACMLVPEGRRLPDYPVPDLVAPGVGVISCLPDDPVQGAVGGYAAKTGTSMAAPVVSGIAALVLEGQRRIGLREFREMLWEHCEPIGGTSRAGAISW